MEIYTRHQEGVHQHDQWLLAYDESFFSTSP